MLQFMVMIDNHNRSLTAAFVCMIIVGLLISSKYWRSGAIVAKDDARPAVVEVEDIDGNFFERNKNDSLTDRADLGTATSTTDNGRLPASNVKYSGPRSYLVGDLVTGEIYMSRNTSVVMPVASMSKLVTAFAVTDSIPLDRVITVTEPETKVASDTSQLFSGERFTVEELLYPLLLNSSNVAAEALASSSDRVKFLELMSSYAWEVGMPATYFADPSGISPQNQSTAEDFFELAKYLYKSRPDILAITRIAKTKTSTTTDHGAHDFVSTHPFVGDPSFIGGKTGRTPEAGETMLTILRIDDHPIAFIILGSEIGNREADTKKLVERFTALHVKTQI